MDDEQDGARAVVVNDCDDVKVARVSQAVRSQDPTGEPHVKRLRAAIAKELCVRRPGGGVARQQDNNNVTRQSSGTRSSPHTTAP